MHMKHRIILRQKPQLKTPLYVLSYKVEIHQKYTKPELSWLASSQWNPHGCLQEIEASHKPSPLPSKPPISLHSFSWVILLLPSERLITHTDPTPCKTTQSSRNLSLTTWMSFLYRKTHETDSNLSLTFSSTRSLSE